MQFKNSSFFDLMKHDRRIFEEALFWNEAEAVQGCVRHRWRLLRNSENDRGSQELVQNFALIPGMMLGFWLNYSVSPGRVLGLHGAGPGYRGDSVF